MASVKVLVACHKPALIPEDKMYFPIQVGSYGKDSIGFQRDDEGVNISALNPYYSELTGLYWAWKNLSCDYLGLVHYRRFFTLNRAGKETEQKLKSVLTEEEVERLLKKHTILVPKKRHYYIETIYSHYSHTFSEEQLILTGRVIKNKYPEYALDYERFMNKRSGYMFNMFIMPKKLADLYCEWLFDILQEVDNQYDKSGLSPFEARYLGRVSERLFNIWLIHQVRVGRVNQSDIQELPYCYIGKINWKRKVFGFLAAKILGRKYNRSF